MEKIKLTPEQLAQYKAIVDSIEKLRSLTEAEKETFRLTAQRNAVNEGIDRAEVVFLSDLSELEAAL